MSTEQTEHLNGVDLRRVAGIAAGYKRDPESGRKDFGARVEWIDGYRTEARLGHYEAFPGDEPKELAGSATGPTPEEMLLGAVGQCLIVGLAGSASARGIRIDSLSVEVEGTVNLTAAYGVQEGNPGFDGIKIRVNLDADADRDQLEQLLDDAVRLAPIPNTVARPVEVVTRLA
jgi:uncharacterized OsmC-like protein